jgi:hypothetical protein
MSAAVAYAIWNDGSVKLAVPSGPTLVRRQVSEVEATETFGAALVAELKAEPYVWFSLYRREEPEQ